jgi:hypothetical protein
MIDVRCLQRAAALLLYLKHQYDTSSTPHFVANHRHVARLAINGRLAEHLCQHFGKSVAQNVYQLMQVQL